MKDPYELTILGADDVIFSRGPGGVFQGVVNGKPYDELVVHRAFPFLYTTKYISVRDTKGEELCIIRDIEELDRESLKEIGTELQYRYFLPRVVRIDSIKQKADLWLWELQTNLGATRMAMRNLHEHLQFPGGGRIILTDLNGRRCEIADWRELDSHSRNELTDVI